jgi:transposase
MTRYIGLDVHKTSTTMAVVGPSGKQLACHVVETNAKQIISVLKTIPRPRLLSLEEGTQSAWLHETLSPHVDDLIVVGIRQQSRGPKDDRRDAFKLADDVRTNSIKTRVFKNVGRYGLLRELARAYRMQVQDSVRVQNRIHALYRSRGLASPGEALFSSATRNSCIENLPPRLQPVADLLVREYDAVQLLRADAETQMLCEARRHRPAKLLATIPGIGKIRAAQILPIIVSPARFRTKRQLWSYCGLGITMRSSADWVQDANGQWQREAVQKTRGLNRNHNATLKGIFKAAATTVIGQAKPENPLYRHYRALTEGKTKPDLAKLTIARQIAAITLAVLKKEEEYDSEKLLKKTT